MAELGLEQVNRALPILGDLGVAFEPAEGGRCPMPVAARVANPFGLLHGGHTLTLADSGMGVVSFTLPGATERAARDGRVAAECRVIRRTARFALAEAEGFDEAGRLLAVAGGVGGSDYISRSEA